MRERGSSMRRMATVSSRTRTLLLHPPVVFWAFICLAASAPLAGQTPPYVLEPLRVTVGSRVSAELPLATRAVEVLTAEDLARRPVRTIHEAIASALGVDLLARSPAQADVAIRGGGVEQVLVLVDGVRVSDAQTGHFDLDLTVPLDDVERIEILRGPGSAVYGADAFGGVINIVTRRRGRSELSGRVEGGSFASVGVAGSAHYANEAIRAGVTAEHRRSDGHRPGTDYEVTAGRTTIEAPIAGRPLRAQIGLARRAFGAAKFYTSPEAPFDEFEITRVLNAAIVWDAPASAKFAIEPGISLRRHDDDFVLQRDDPGFYRNVHRTWQLGGELTARYAADRVRLAVGGEAYRDILESTNLGDRGEERAALFAESGIGRAGGSLLSTGLRADWHSAFGAFVAPSLAAAHWLRPDLHVRASVSRAFRAPTWTDRYYSDPANIGNPDLTPEQGWEGELGAELAAGRATVSLGGFLRYAGSLIDWARPAGSAPTDPWHTMNIEGATFRGLELALEDLTLSGIRVAARASLLAFDAETDGDIESKSALRPLTRQASVDVEPPAVAGVSLFLRGSYARRASEDSYVRLDARIARRFGTVRLFIDATNLTDAEYLDVSRLPAPGAAVRAGVEWRRPDATRR